MKSEYITPFVNAVQSTFQTMIGIDAKPGKPSLRKPGEPVTAAYQVCGVIGMSGAAKGRVAVGFSGDTARSVVASFVGAQDPVALTPADIADGVGEITNMVAGAAKAAVHKDGQEMINISIPNVLTGDTLSIAPASGHASIIVPFETVKGVFHLEVAFKTE
ncbi:MAG: chemotaxis protein CheX [Planctomycetes bacterium]|nr:chemotaxis protein CheX [Planctomycetota bacterium]NUQ34135.1 chemotaxis protein CheX [Planctomycetaceae bacterium]